jgi:MoxR-like ATPase
MKSLNINSFWKQTSISILILTGLLSVASANPNYLCGRFYRKVIKSRVVRGDGFENIHPTKVNAAWEISRVGLAELASEIYGSESFLYYLGTGILAKENVLADGPGGGAKTFSVTKVLEAQLNAVRGVDEEALKSLHKDIVFFIEEIKKIADEERTEIKDPSKRLFTLQFHQLLNESAILGGPNPLKFVKEGVYEIDYSQALIAEKNIFAVLDEVEKAPVNIQMMVLSILNERQALAGNKVIETALESIWATTNATSGQLVSQGSPEQIGGRMAFYDRFALKFHVVNVDASEKDGFLFIEKVNPEKGGKKFTIVDLRVLRNLLPKITIPKELLDSAAEVSAQMDLIYSEYYKTAKEEAERERKTPRFYPPFSGSIRTNSKVIPLWQSAFLMRQLLMGVPFESVRLKMEAKDLVDLSPALLQGGPDQIVSQLGQRIPFLQFKEIEDFNDGSDNPEISSENRLVFAMSNYNSKDHPKKNSPSRGNAKSKTNVFEENSISIGIYDPSTQIFSYKSLNSQKMQRLYFDSKNKKLVIANKEVAKELGQGLDLDQVIFKGSERKARRFENINEKLARVQKKYDEAVVKPVKTEYKLYGTLAEYIDNPKSLLRTDSKKQLAEIKNFHDRFLDIINTKIRDLSQVKLNTLDPSAYIQKDLEFKNQAAKLEGELVQALAEQNADKLLEASAKSIRQTMEEAAFRFRNSAPTVAAIIKVMNARRNLMLFGPQGSAKTMFSRMILEKELEWITEAQAAQLNHLLIQVLPNASKQKGNLWIKQFHPMTTEGDILGRLDLKAIEQGQGYKYNVTGTLSAKDVFFALLDEFEKAPPGVRTALLSILNERKVFNGSDPTISNIIAIIITTNSTPSEFITGQGDFHEAFPIYDRIQWKAYSFNKFSVSDLKEFYYRIYLRQKPQILSPLFMSPISTLSKNVVTTPPDRELLNKIYYEFMSQAVARSDSEYQIHLSNKEEVPTFFIQSRGESRRSKMSTIYSELAPTIQMNRVMKGESVTKLKEKYRFELKDLESYAELFLTHNDAYSVKAEYDADGLLIFKVIARDHSGLQGHIPDREKDTMDGFKWEADLIASVINLNLQAMLRTSVETIKENPLMYQSVFENSTARKQWLYRNGVSEADLEKPLF